MFERVFHQDLKRPPWDQGLFRGAGHIEPDPEGHFKVAFLYPEIAVQAVDFLCQGADGVLMLFEVMAQERSGAAGHVQRPVRVVEYLRRDRVQRIVEEVRVELCAQPMQLGMCGILFRKDPLRFGRPGFAPGHHPSIDRHPTDQDCEIIGCRNRCDVTVAPRERLAETSKNSATDCGKQGSGQNAKREAKKHET